MLLLSSSANFIEKQWLSDAKNDIDKNCDFKKTIIMMMQKMVNSEESELTNLTPKVKELLDDLIMTYGTPTPMKKNWKDKDPDYVFVPGSGRVGGSWRSREELIARKKEREYEQKHGHDGKDTIWLMILKWSLWTILFVFVFFMLILRLFPYITSKYGETAMLLSVVAFLIVIMIILFVKGRLKRQPNK